MAWLKKRNKIWYILFREEGKITAISTKTHVKKEALNKLADFELGKTVHAKKIRLEKFKETYLDHTTTNHSPQWQKNKRLIFDNFLIPFFGPKTLISNITTKKIDLYRAERLKTVSNRTVNIEVNCVMAMLRKAIEWGDLEESSLPRIKKLPEKKGRLRFLSLEEIQKLIEAANDFSPGMAAYVMLGLYTGLRSGEALNLRWQDVDLDRKLIHITPYDGWKPKDYECRSIPCPVDLREILFERRKNLADAVLVLDGDKYSPYILKRRFHKVVEAAKLPTEGDMKVTAHTLRHTYASHLVMKGVPLFTVGALLGHSDAKTTQIYAHLAPDHLQDAAQLISYK